MAQNISINFKVSGSELSQYITTVQQKSEKLANDAIKSAIEQSKASKEQLRIINEQIAAKERLSRVEAQAARSLILDKRDEAIKQNRGIIEQEKQQVRDDVKNKIISSDQGFDKIEGIRSKGEANEEKIRNSYKEELLTLKEQEKQQKLQTSLTKQVIQEAKNAARDQVAEIRAGNKTLASVYREVGDTPSEEEKLSLKLIEEQLQQDKKNRAKQDKEDKKNSLFSSMLAVDNINRIISTAGQLTQTQNGFDLIQPASNLAGRIVGGVVGGAIGALMGGVGAVSGAAVGSSIGGGFGDVFGALQQREALSKEKFRKSVLKYNSITGTEVDSSEIPDMSGSGVNFTHYMEMRSEFARRRGNATDSDKTTRDAVYLEKGFGIEQNTSLALTELLRSNKETDKDLTKIVGGVLEKGQGNIFKNGDVTFANEFLNKYSSLHKELLKNSTTVSSGLTFDVLKQFDSMGGMFSSRDSRSSGIISSIDSSLSNPNSDNTKAIAYRLLSNQYPNKGFFDLREEMQKGLASPNYLKSVLGYIDEVGGDDQSKMNNLSGFFNQLPFSAIRTLFQNRKNLKSFNTEELNNIGLSEEVMKGKSEKNTTYLEVNEAKIENGILSGEAIDKMVAAFRTAVEVSMSGAAIELKNGQGTIQFKKQEQQRVENIIKREKNEKAKQVNIANFYKDPVI